MRFTREVPALIDSEPSRERGVFFKKSLSGQNPTNRLAKRQTGPYSPLPPVEDGSLKQTLVKNFTKYLSDFPAQAFLIVRFARIGL